VKLLSVWAWIKLAGTDFRGFLIRVRSNLIFTCMEFSSNISRLQPSATIAVSTLAKRLRAEGRDIIDLSAGEPDFGTPEWISDGAIEGIQSGATRYTPVSGIPELRRAIAGYLESVGNRKVDWEGVVVAAGAKQSLFNAAFALFGPGDEVLIGAPYWTSYPQMVALARAEPIPVAGDASRNFLLTRTELDDACTERTRGLILCSPSNPTGAVYTLEELREIAEWAKENDVVLIADEIYREIYFGDDRPTAPSILQLPEESLGRYVLIDGASKCFAMTGWRIGFSYSDVETAKKLGALQSHATSNAAAPSQAAALAAYSDLERADEAKRQMTATFRGRRDRAVGLLKELLPQLSFVEPMGAFYFFIRVDALFREGVSDSTTLCSWLLEESGVAMVPGVAFGDDRFVRVSFATSDELMESAIRRVAEAVSSSASTPQ
jgi:aspartate aminotransferase